MIKSISQINFVEKFEEFLKLFNGKSGRFLVVDFGQAIIKIVYVESLPGGIKLLAYDIRRLSPEEEKSDEAAVRFINEFIRKNAVAEKTVIVTISDVDSVAIKFLAMPYMPEKEIRAAAQWKLKDVVPFDLEQSVVDWQFVGDYVDEDGAKNRGMIFIAAANAVIARYLAVVEKCSLEPLGMTSSPFNYANVLSCLPENPKVSAVLDVDYRGSTLSVYSNNRLNFVRRLPISWGKLTQSLTEVVVSGEGTIELSYDEAENIKNTFGIAEDGSQVIRDKVQATHILSLLRPLLETLVRDLKFSFQHFASNFNAQAPAALYLTGGGSNLKNLDKYLGGELNLPVSYLPLPACVDAQILDKEKVDGNNRNKIINALGAAFHDPSPINLLPEEVKGRRIEQIQRAVLRLAGVAAGLIFCLLVLGAQIQINDYKNRLKNAKTHLRIMDEISGLKQKIREREDLLGKIQENRAPAAGVLKSISALVPEEIVLDELSLDQEKHNVAMKGTIPAVENVAEEILTGFMQRLESSPFFGEAGLVSSQRVEGSQKFEILVELGSP